mmetsp:Transcript_5134/g.12868  ORF Transcript_5134/g.12868 Transcript_5134/m.12868 type:complete len:293 (+) Transcript_5134:108-986(+)
MQSRTLQLSATILVALLASLCCAPHRTSAEYEDSELPPSGVVSLDQVSFERIVGRGDLSVVVQFAQSPLERHVDTAARHFVSYPDLLFAHTSDPVLLARFASELLVSDSEETMHATVICFFGVGAKTQEQAERLDVIDTASLIAEVSNRLVPQLPKLVELWKHLSESEHPSAELTDELYKRAQELITSSNALAQQYGTLLESTLKRTQQRGADFVDKEIERVKGLLANSQAIAAHKVSAFRDRLRRMAVLFGKMVDLADDPLPEYSAADPAMDMDPYGMDAMDMMGDMGDFY